MRNGVSQVWEPKISKYGMRYYELFENNLRDLLSPTDLSADGRAWVNSLDEASAPNGIRCEISETDHGWRIDAYINDEHVGSLSIGTARYGRGGFAAMNVSVDKEYRRKGVATAMYDFAYKSGLAPLYPDSKQSGDGSNFWHGTRMKKLKLGRPLPPMEWGKLRGLRKPKNLKT